MGVAATLAALFAAAGAAHAQLDADPTDPYATGERAATQNDLDTDITPVAKRDRAAALWTHVAGARFGETGPIQSPVPYDASDQVPFDVSLYDVAFQNTRLGLAGGASCRNPESGEAPEPGTEQVGECRPVIYEYANPHTADPAWRRVALPGEGESGYVGAIAWIDADTAVAVGGDGRYPRRELPRTAGAETLSYEEWLEQDEREGAGMARAWLYDGGSWRELSAERGELPAGARGMSAIAFHSSGTPGWAGALGQLWRWEGGRFTERIDMHTDAALPANRRRIVQGDLFEYRVRDIRFRPIEQVRAVAVTAGCCAEDPAHNIARLLLYSEGGGDFGANLAGRTWFVRSLGWDARQDVRGAGAGAGADIGPEASRINHEPGLPDSFYSVTVGDWGKTVVSVLAAVGGSAAADERPSAISQRYCPSASTLLEPVGGDVGNTLSAFAEVTRTSVSTARLVAADGDSGISSPLGGGYYLRHSSNPGTQSSLMTACNSTGDDVGDVIPDWLVGELRSTHAHELGSQALTVATHLRPVLIGETVNIALDSENNQIPPVLPPERPSAADLAGGDYEATTPERLREDLRSQHYLLPTYSLNAIDMVGNAGVGWAVGDHGAIFHLRESGSGSDQSGGGEPEAPRLGAGGAAELEGPEAYEGVRPPLARDTGAVPSLRSMPPRLLDGLEPVAAGAADPTRPRDRPVEDVSAIVMSRDGSEGWAIGPTEINLNADFVTTLYHYDGATWSRCDTLGVPGQPAPDPACEGIAGLRRFTLDNGNSKTVTSVRLIAATRIPFEHDSDPTNDDEFEVVAVGTVYQEPGTEKALPALLRYRDGRWLVEDAEARKAVDFSPSGLAPPTIAFGAEDDGWIAAGGDSGHSLFHFDGERWVDCGLASNCGDPNRLLVSAPAAADPGAIVSGVVGAGPRVYAYGYRKASNRQVYPLVAYRDTGGVWRVEGGGFDPGGGEVDDLGPLSQDPNQGRVQSLAVSIRPDGRYEGWAVGGFGRSAVPVEPPPGIVPEMPEATLLRLEPGESWEIFRDTGPIADYLAPTTVRTDPDRQLTLPGNEEASPAYIAQPQSGRIFRFDPERRRWEIAPSGRPPDSASTVSGDVQAIAPDGEGGFWAAVSNNRAANAGSHVNFFHYTDHPPQDVFREAPHPMSEPDSRINALAGAADGSVWAATSMGTVARYERITGWQEARVPGWDPGRLLTRASEVNALALGPDGKGIAVGEGGRIAQLGPSSIRLDPAAGTRCPSIGSGAPCGTGHDLEAAAVAPDGSAIAAGQRLVLLWRPAGGEFRRIPSPEAPLSTTITATSMPRSDRAYLALDNGSVMGGVMSSPGEWHWRRENELSNGQPIGLDDLGQPLALRAISVDAGGRGLAVGDRGLIIERTGDGESPWQRLDTPYLDDLTSVALPVGEGDGALIGGRNGLVLTRVGGEFEIARPADYFTTGENGELTGPVSGLALMPGTEPGQVEAWAAIEARGAGTNRVLHYASDATDPLLNPAARALPLPDSPPPREGELSFAAFGKTECRAPINRFCEARMETTAEYEVISRRIGEEIAARSDTDADPQFALFSGDAVDSATAPASDVADRARLRTTFTDGPRKLRRWVEQVADPLQGQGVPLFGAIGSQDLSEAFACNTEGSCLTTKQHAKSGDNLAWRQALSERPTPWGGADDPEGNGALSFEPIGDSGFALRHEDLHADVDDEGFAPEADVPTGGASTHYALDVFRDDEAAARLIVLDNSLRSLASSDPVQQPFEAAGQREWLESMLCFEGGATSIGTGCSREPGQHAIVLANTPTYSYGPGVLADTATDAADLESLLLKHKASVVVSGRLGWNGLYWASAPGVHEPCPGGAYPERPPAPGTQVCGNATSGGGLTVPELDTSSLSADLGATGLLPFVVASGGGGKFGPDGAADGSASEGYWHGYTIVRLDPSGDPRQTIVEQRPVHDWIGIEASTNVVGPKQELSLRGFGREPIGSPSFGSGPPVTRFNEISSAAITHRYDLLLADPDEPWVPCPASDAACVSLRSKLSEGSRSFASGVASGSGSAQDDKCHPYLCLPERVGTIDAQSGRVKAGDGKYPDTFALAALSAGDHVATWPLVFRRSPSFVVQPFALTAPVPGAPPLSPNAPQAPPPPNPPAPNVPQPDVPNVSAPPSVPPIAASEPPEPQPPAPPVPPPPTEQPSPLSLTLAPPGLAIATPTAVIQPPTPPVNPAPPGGARREARQRQAAAQKSGADNDESQEGGSETPDALDSRTQPATRLDRARPEPSFTALARADQPSAWAQGALYAGGLTLVAAALAIGWQGVRPTPRRTPPTAPAPAYAKARRRVP